MKPNTGVEMAFPLLPVQALDCEEQSLSRRQTSWGLARPTMSDRRRTNYCLLLPLLKNNIG